MNVLELPFNRFIGLCSSGKPEYIFMLDEKGEYLNHLGTVHASALYALAEATSGYFLLNEFSELTGIIPVVRKVETKYRKPANGKIYSSAQFADNSRESIIEELGKRGKILIVVRSLLYDASGNVVMQSDFEWFLTNDR